MSEKQADSLKKYKLRIGEWVNIHFDEMKFSEVMNSTNVWRQVTST